MNELELKAIFGEMKDDTRFNLYLKSGRNFLIDKKDTEIICDSGILRVKANDNLTSFVPISNIDYIEFFTD